MSQKESSYKKLPAAKAQEEKKHWIFLKTRDKKMDYLVECAELVASKWLAFVRMMRADPVIPAPLLTLGPYSPFSFQWQDPKNPGNTIRAIIPELFDSIEVDVTGNGGDSYKKMSPEEAYAAIKAVFTA